MGIFLKYPLLSKFKFMGESFFLLLTIFIRKNLKLKVEKDQK